MAEELNEEEEFWNRKKDQEQITHFEIKNKKDEFNNNSKKEEINSNKQEQLEDQSHEHLKADEKMNGNAEERSVRIGKLIKSLEKLKPTYSDRNVISDSQKSNAYSGYDDQHSDSSRNENHVDSVGDNHLQIGNTDAATDSDELDSDSETHGKDKKIKSDLMLKDGKSMDDNSDRSASGFSHPKGYEEVVTGQDTKMTKRKETVEADSLSECKTFIDYGLSLEEPQLKRDSLETPDDGFMVTADSQEKILEAHPPKSPAPHQSRRKTRKPDVAKTSKGSHYNVKAQNVGNQHPEKVKERSFDEIQSQKISQEASSGKENFSTPKVTQKRGTRNRRRVKSPRNSSAEDLKKDAARAETEGSQSPPRMQKEFRSGGYDWSLSGNEEIREWVKNKNQMARKQKAEDRRNERIKKQEAEGKMIGLDVNLENKPTESLKRKKKPKLKQRSNSYPGDGKASDREVLPRSRSQPRMSKELKSGSFDWSTSKNEEIRLWLKKKKRLLRRQRAEERKKEKMKKKEEEQKRREHEEKYADSFERVSEWMKQKKRQEYMLKKKLKAEQLRIEQENEKVMVIGRKLNYEPVLTERQEANKEKETTLRMDEKHEQALKEQHKAEPLLKQREKQKQLVLRTGPKQQINPNKTLNLSHLAKEKEKAESLSKNPAKQTQQDADTIEEIISQETATITNLPSADKRIKPVKTPVRRLNEPLLPRQSLSPSRATNPPGSGRVGTEPENVKKKITYDEWLRRKEVEDERKRLAEQAAKERDKGLGGSEKELNKSAEFKKINLSPEKKRVPIRSAENLSKPVTRLKSASRREKQPQLLLDQGLATSQQQESSGDKPHSGDEASTEDILNVRQLAAETSENSTRPSRPLSSKGSRPGQSDKMTASDVTTDKVPNPYVKGGSDIPATAHRAKSPKPKVAVKPTLRSVKYQRGSWDGFSNYLWDQVNEEEGGELTTSRDKQRLEPTGAEADKIEANFEKKTEKLKDSSRQSEKVEAKAETYEGPVSRESTLAMSLELNSNGNTESEISKVPYIGNQANKDTKQLKTREKKSREWEELPNKSNKSKMPRKTKEVDDNFHESDMKNYREDLATDLIHEEEETQTPNLTERESNSILTLNADSGFGMSSARRHDIRTIIDAEDEETESELEAGTKPELKMDSKAETRRENKKESEMEVHEKKHRTEKDKKTGIPLSQHSSPGNHVNLGDSEDEITSDMDFPRSEYSKAD